MSTKVNDYERLLQDLSLRLGDEDSSMIRTVLEKVHSSPLLCPYLSLSL